MQNLRFIFLLLGMSIFISASAQDSLVSLTPTRIPVSVHAAILSGEPQIKPTPRNLALPGYMADVLVAIREGDLGQAKESALLYIHFTDSKEDIEVPGMAIQLYLMADYLEKYSDEGSPMFAHFNGGYYEFLKKNLQNKAFRYNTDDWSSDAISVLSWVILSLENKNLQHWEMLGDLLVKHPNEPRVTYLAALAYIAASPDDKIYKVKAAMAMESAGIPAGRHNRVRLAELGEALDEEVTFMMTHPARLDNPESLTFWPEETESPFMEFVNRYAGIDLEATGNPNNPNSNITNPSLDLVAIKTNKTYNLYALLIIGTLILAVIIIWRKFKKREKELQRE